MAERDQVRSRNSSTHQLQGRRRKRQKKAKGQKSWRRDRTYDREREVSVHKSRLRRAPRSASK